MIESICMPYITQDDVTIRFTIKVFTKVSDAVKFTYETQNSFYEIEHMLVEELRYQVGKVDNHHINTDELSNLANYVKEELKTKIATKYGVEVYRIETGKII